MSFALVPPPPPPTFFSRRRSGGGAMYDAVCEGTGGMFPDAKGFKPKSSREVSREMYIVGTRHRVR